MGWHPSDHRGLRSLPLHIRRSDDRSLLRPEAEGEANTSNTYCTRHNGRQGALQRAEQRRASAYNANDAPFAAIQRARVQFEETDRREMLLRARLTGDAKILDPKTGLPGLALAE